MKLRPLSLHRKHPPGALQHICWGTESQSSASPRSQQGPAWDTRQQPRGALSARDTHPVTFLLLFSPLKAPVAELTPQNTQATVTNSFPPAQNAELKQVRGEETHLFQDSSYGRVQVQTLGVREEYQASYSCCRKFKLIFLHFSN